MNHDDDKVRIKIRPPGAGRTRGDGRFLTRVLTAASRSGHFPALARSGALAAGRARPHRGAVASRLSRVHLDARSRRVIVKVRLVRLRGKASGAVATHLRYLVRDGVVAPDGTPGQAYDTETTAADVKAFEARCRADRHQFRFIVSPEDAVQLEDLRGYTRELVTRMERDLQTRLEWVAVDHWDTDNPHTHVVVRGVDQTGRDLVIDRHYLSHGMRQRACELASEWLGPRTELEIRQSHEKEVSQERWTDLDRVLSEQVKHSVIDVTRLPRDPAIGPSRRQAIGRLQHLEAMELARRLDAGRWHLRAEAETVLRQLGERGDIVRTMQRAFEPEQRQLAIAGTSPPARPIIGQIMAKGLADELTDRPYVVVDGIDGVGHYVTLPTGTDLSQLPIGGIVELRASSERRADRTIAALAPDGVYQTDVHRAQLRANPPAGIDPEELVEGHVRRLEALRRAGIVERLTAGLWRVPADLVARGKAYDLARNGGTSVVLQSHLPIDRQIRAIGATWLDHQLVASTPAAVAAAGFGVSVREALDARVDFLAEQGLAQRRGRQVVLASDLLNELRRRELDRAANILATESGLTHRSVPEGTSVSGVYGRSLQLVSGRFAMLDDGLGFSLVPWRPVIEQHLGKTISAVVRGDQVAWQLGRQRGLAR